MLNPNKLSQHENVRVKGISWEHMLRGRICFLDEIDMNTSSQQLWSVTGISIVMKEIEFEDVRLAYCPIPRELMVRLQWNINLNLNM